MIAHMNNNVLAVFAILLIFLSIFSQVVVFTKTEGFEEEINRVTGKVSGTGTIMLTITAPPDTGFSTLMNLGQNWMSIPVKTPSTNISVVLDSLGKGSGTGHTTFAGMAGCTNDSNDDFIGNYTVVWWFNASDFADHWKSYTPDKPCFAIPLEDLPEMTHKWTYQIMMNTSDNLTGDGMYAGATIIPVESGMNRVGFPRTQPRSVASSFTSLGKGSGTGHTVFAGMAGCTNNSNDDYVGNYTVLWSYNSSDLIDPWKSYTPDKPCFAMPLEDLLKMTPTSGYQLMMNTSEIWVIDW